MNEEPYETKDIVQATALICYGVPSKGTRYDQTTKKSYFKFEKIDELQDYIQAFENREMLVIPQDFNNHLRDLKAIIYNHRG